MPVDRNRKLFNTGQSGEFVDGTVHVRMRTAFEEFGMIWRIWMTLEHLGGLWRNFNV